VDRGICTIAPWQSTVPVIKQFPFFMKANPCHFSLSALSIAAATLLGWAAALRSATVPAAEATNRPLRNRQAPVLTVGQNEGDLRGNDDKIIQAGVEYLHRLGGGTLRLLPGRYTLRNAIYLRSHINLQGSGQSTVLEKADGVVTEVARDADWFEYGVRVKDPKGFVPGGGIMLQAKTGPGDWQRDVLLATITAIRGDVIFIDQIPQKNFWTEKNATATAVFPLLTAEHADDVGIKDLVLDGRREKNEHINGNFSGAVFIQHCNRWRFENVEARDYNGDGFSVQVADDMQFQNCRASHNADLGFHPGSGDQRPVFRDCTASGNHIGLFFCWSVSDGRIENCTFSDNDYGISIGHRDTDNLIRGCTFERNGEAGILFRDEAVEFRAGHRNLIENCTIRDTGKDKPGIGIDIQGQTQDISIHQVTFENKPGGKQNTAIRIGKDAQRISLQNNKFIGCPTEVEDLRPRPAGGK
jgi:parallel beta-helix repeat protein